MSTKSLSPSDKEYLQTVFKRMIVAHAQHERTARDYLQQHYNLLLTRFSDERPEWVPPQELHRMLLAIGVRHVRFEALRDNLFDCQFVKDSETADALIGKNESWDTSAHHVVDYWVFALLVGLAEYTHFSSVTFRPEDCRHVYYYGLTISEILEDPQRNAMIYARRVLRTAMAADKENLDLVRSALCFHAPTAYRLFGRVDSVDDALALRFDLKTRSAGENVRRFDKKVRRLLREFGLPVDLVDPYR